MIVSFHSRGASPKTANVFQGIPGPIRIIRPAGFHETSDGGYTWLASPSKGVPEGYVEEMGQRGEQLGDFVYGLTRCYPTLGRPIVTGSSEGGHMSYLMASRHPELVSGAVSLLGYLPPELWNSDMAPTVGLHSTGDTTVPYDRTRQYWDEMKRQGARMVTQSYSGGHSVSSEMLGAWTDVLRGFVDQLK